MEKKLKIQRVSSGVLGQVIEHRIPCGLFLTKEGRKWVAVDNTTGDAWTEEFSRKRQAVRWLRGKFEVCWCNTVSTLQPCDTAAKLLKLRVRTRQGRRSKSCSNSTVSPGMTRKSPTFPRRRSTHEQGSSRTSGQWDHA